MTIISEPLKNFWMKPDWLGSQGRRKGSRHTSRHLPLSVSSRRVSQRLNHGGSSKVQSHWISTVLGALSAFGIGFLTYLTIPDEPFMELAEMQVVDGQVIVKSGINAPEVVADWIVTVVGEDSDAPSCHTSPGPELHQGWSRYKPRALRTNSFSMDVWVADERGCYNRLPPGNYTMHVTWTPRDGRDPVPAKADFSVPETPEGSL